MLQRKIRRVFIAEEPEAFASDREILDFLLSPDSLARARESPGDFLRATLSDVPWRPALRLEGSTKVAEALDTYEKLSGAWCALVESGVVTPWDLLMGPWERGDLALPLEELRPSGVSPVEPASVAAVLHKV